MNVGTMQAMKAKAVKGLTGGIEQLFKKNKVDYFKAHATITGKNDISLTPIDGSAKSTINTTNIIIATGSVPATLAGLDGALAQRRNSGGTARQIMAGGDAVPCERSIVCMQ